MILNVYTIPPPVHAELHGAFFAEVKNDHEIPKAAGKALQEAVEKLGPTHKQVFDLKIYDFKVTAVAIADRTASANIYYLLTGTFAAQKYQR